MFAVYSCCQPSRPPLLFPSDLSKFSGEMDSMDSTPEPPPILTANNQSSGASVPAPRVNCNRALIHPSGQSRLPRGAQRPALNALLVLTTSRKNNHLGSLLFAQTDLQRAPIRAVLTQFWSSRQAAGSGLFSSSQLFEPHDERPCRYSPRVGQTVLTIPFAQSNTALLTG